MDRVIIAFESENSRSRVKDVLEREGITPSVCLASGAGALRAVLQMGGGVIVSGFKLSDMSAIELAASLPENCILLVVAPVVQMNLYYGDNVFKVAAPVSRSDLAASVRMLMQFDHRKSKKPLPMRTEDDNLVIANAKLLLMERNHMLEDEAHRFMQKKSMYSGFRLVDIAKQILDSNC